MQDYTVEERSKQIETLLSCPGVGPLSAAVIAVNLGVAEPDIEPVLASMWRQGRLEQTLHTSGDPSILWSVTTIMPRPSGGRRKHSETGGRR